MEYKLIFIIGATRSEGNIIIISYYIKCTPSTQLYYLYSLFGLPVWRFISDHHSGPSYLKFSKT